MGLKITLIEPHLEGAQFGPQALNGGEQESAEQDNQASSAESRSNFRRVIGVIAVSALLLAGYRIIRSRNDISSVEVGSHEIPRIEQSVESVPE